jgi:hypothetical protein
MSESALERLNQEAREKEVEKKAKAFRRDQSEKKRVEQVRLSKAIYVELLASHAPTSTVPITPSMVQPFTKPIGPLRDATSLEIIPLPVQTFIIHVPVTIIVNQPVEGSERSDKEQVELVNPSFIILNNRLEYLEFISLSVPLTPHLINRRL